MKVFIAAMLLVALSGGAAFGQAISTTIYDCRTAAVAVNTEVDLTTTTIVVTAVRDNGFACTEIPAGPQTAIWVYTGDAPTVVAGDVITITSGEYKEYYDLSEIDMGTYAGTVTATGTMAVPALPMALDDVLLDAEAWESHVLTITDGFMITELLSYGEWTAQSFDGGSTLGFDDIFFDGTVLMVGDCYQNVTGMYTYSFGAYKLNPLVDGLVTQDCAVANEDVSFGAVKGMYR
ncbi:MAG: hypothetical protein QNL91_07570 [Candidatus Krumholzibacteria bacterium]|nr:hypothetical protein [Candidatus Krumholzibacteria bacterium]